MNAAAWGRISRGLTLTAFAVAIMILAAAPVIAHSWRSWPFPGFMVEHSLVISDVDGLGWHGRRAGLAHPQRLIEIEGLRVARAEDFHAIMEHQSPENPLSIRTVLPDGTAFAYPPVAVRAFQDRDLLRLFGVPYAVGVVYLLLGLWVYAKSGHTPSGAAFARFCASTTVLLSLIFDLTTSHRGKGLWTVALALQGGFLIELAMLLPIKGRLVQRHRWLMFLPYGLSVALGLWGLSAIYLSPDPWAYISAWRACYAYVSAGIATLFGAMLFHQVAGRTTQIRQQARVIGWGSAFSFFPLGLWSIAPVFGHFIPFNGYVFLLPLLIFPAFLAVAISRYRLWDVDVIVNRTLVYSALTVLLGGIYALGVIGSQRIFTDMTGNSTPLAVAMSTLGIAVLYQPLRRNLQNLIDRQLYRKKYDAARTIAAFGTTLRDLGDGSQLAHHLISVLRETLNPAHVGVWLKSAESFELIANTVQKTHAQFIPIGPHDPLVGHLSRLDGVVEVRRLVLNSPGLQQLQNQGAVLILPLVSQGELLGWVSLGPQAGDQGYSTDDRALLEHLARQSAPAVRVVFLVRKRQVETAEREQLEYELAVARKIQQALLPRSLPLSSGWQFAVHYQPARQIGGDFYDFLTMPDGRIYFCVGDVVDKGIPAALVMAAARTILRAAARETNSPGEALARSNDLLQPELPPGIFVTCLIGLLDPLSGNLELANAGHAPALHLGGGTTSLLNAKGMPLGLMPGMSYERMQLVLEPGELLLIYSDGLVEAHNPDGEIFGGPRLQTFVAQAEPDCHLQIKHLLDALHSFTGPGWKQEDDVTIVALARQPVTTNTASEDQMGSQLEAIELR